MDMMIVDGGDQIPVKMKHSLDINYYICHIQNKSIYVYFLYCSVVLILCTLVYMCTVFYEGMNTQLIMFTGSNMNVFHSFISQGNNSIVSFSLK